MVGEQLKYVVCNWMLHMKYKIVLIVHLLIVLGRLSINEICSSALKFMKIDTTAVCVKTLDQHHVCEVLVQHGQCEAVYYKADYKEQDIVTCLDVLKRKTITEWSGEDYWKNKNAEFERERESLRIQYRDCLFATHSTEEREHLLKSNTLLKNYMIVSNQDDIKRGLKFDSELVANCLNYKCSSLQVYNNTVVVRLDILQTNDIYELMIRKEVALSLQRLTQDMSRIVIQRFEFYFNDNPNDDSLGTSIEMNLQDTSGPVSMKTNGELRKEEYNLFTNSTKCQLCVDRNKAVNWCNTCGKNICDFCKVFHQKVWDVMDHDILPLRIAY